MEINLFEAKNGSQTYNSIRNSTDNIDTQLRETLNVAYNKYSLYLDHNFATSFPPEIEAKVFELHLAHNLSEQSCVLKKGVKKGEPDFCILKDNSRIWLEAKLITIGGDKTLKDFKNSGGGWVPEDNIVLRLTSAIKDKYFQYKKRVNNEIVSENEPYIIAINGHDTCTQNDISKPYILDAAFGIGAEYAKLDIQTKKTIGGGYQKAVTRNKIKEGNEIEEIDCKFFLDRSYEGISAILYSHASIYNMSNDYIILSNPYAKNPLPLDFIKGKIIFHVGYNTKGQKIVTHSLF